MKIGSVVLMALTSPGAIQALEISSIYSDFSPMAFGFLLDMLGRWCCDQVGQGAGAYFFKGINYDKG